MQSSFFLGRYANIYPISCYRQREINISCPFYHIAMVYLVYNYANKSDIIIQSHHSTLSHLNIKLHFIILKKYLLL